MRRRPAVRDRAAARGGRAARRPHRAHGRDAHARRPRLGPRPARARAWHPGQHPRRRRRRLPARPDGGRRRDRGRRGRRCGVIHTPGHRPEHCCLTVDRPLARRRALARADRRLALRRRCGAAGSRRRRGRRAPKGLFHSLRRLLELSDGVEVFPGHVAGSLCGKSMSSKPSTTIGFERRFNPTLQLTAVDEFIADASRDQRAEAAEPGAHRRRQPRPVPRSAAARAGARGAS